MAAPFDGRALALMYGSRRVLDGMGLWPAFADIAEPVRGVRVRDEGTGAAWRIDAAALGEEAFAYGITNRALRRRLLELCRSRPGITLLAPARVAGLRAPGRCRDRDPGRRPRADAPRWSSAPTAAARWCASSPASAPGAGAIRRARSPSPLRLAQPHDGCVHELLRPAGPLALLPIGPELCSVTWVESRAVADELLRLEPRKPAARAAGPDRGRPGGGGALRRADRPSA